MTTTPTSRRIATRGVDVARVVLPLDGSLEAERALGAARWLSDGLDASLEIVHVTSRREDVATSHHLGELADAHGAQCTVLAADHVADALASHVVAGLPALVCIATHGRDRSSAIVGSTAATLVDLLHDPIVLVGPQAQTAPPDASAPVVVAVGGRAEDHDLVHIASQWATRLARRLVLATVVEPAPATLRGEHLPSRAHGPADPDVYLTELMAPLQRVGIEVTGEVISDPVSVDGGIVGWLQRTPTAMVVMGSSHRSGVGRLLHGATAARVAHDSPCPVLVAELGWRR